MQRLPRIVLSCVAVWALAPTAGALDCVSVRTSAPYRNLGYDHVVHITNGCDKQVTCRVSTNVNPETITVQIPREKSVDVVTFRGSPARTFQAKVSCS